MIPWAMKVGKKNQKKKPQFFLVATDFFCNFFGPLVWENSKDSSLASNLPKIAKNLKKPDLKTLERTGGADWGSRETRGT